MALRSRRPLGLYVQDIGHESNIYILFNISFEYQCHGRRFFPDDYKSFPFKEGDLLTSEKGDGKYSINKVLKIDKVVLSAGHSINIQGQFFKAPVEDFLLVISMSYGEDEFYSLVETKKAAKQGKWTVQIGHIPSRPPGAASGQILIGHQAVSEEDLSGYKEWKEAFLKGEAGIF